MNILSIQHILNTEFIGIIILFLMLLQNYWYLLNPTTQLKKGKSTNSSFRSVSQSFLHGHEIPRLFHHKNCVQLFSNEDCLWQYPVNKKVEQVSLREEKPKDELMLIHTIDARVSVILRMVYFCFNYDICKFEVLIQSFSFFLLLAFLWLVKKQILTLKTKRETQNNMEHVKFFNNKIITIIH